MKKIGWLICLMMLAVQAAFFPEGQALADGMVCHFQDTDSRIVIDDRLTINYSHMDQGYVMVQAKKTGSKTQLVVKCGSDTICCGINDEGNFEMIPLQMGSGSYRFTLLAAEGSRFAVAGDITLDYSMADAADVI